MTRDHCRGCGLGHTARRQQRAPTTPHRHRHVADSQTQPVVFWCFHRWHSFDAPRRVQHPSQPRMYVVPPIPTSLNRHRITLVRAGVDFAHVDLDFIRTYAAAVMQCSPVSYLKGAQLHGQLFEELCTDGAVSLADTNYYVDHAEPLEVFRSYLSAEKWRLGSLRDGHEFILLIPLPLQ